MNVRIAGAAGQGVQTSADLLGKAILRSGLFAYLYTDAESRIRGGLNFSHIRLSVQPRMGVVDELDALVALTSEAFEAFGDRVGEDGLLIGEKEFDHPAMAPFSLGAMARQIGSPKVSGTIGIAALCAMLGIEKDTLDQVVDERFGRKETASELNTRAVTAGYEAGCNWSRGSRYRMAQRPDGATRSWVAGHEAVSLGALAGGVRFVAGYPMSPATSILANLASWAKEAGLLVEQAEDEIAAINMVAGASYAGARSMTATSGGGFCLMTEGVSLLGMIEAPAVIILGQRPGPSTGLPTRTAQGDLHLVLHAGHGFFPRIILAPKDIPDCLAITARAFDMAERYQVPVFVLTDQLLLDSQAVVEPFDVSDLPNRRYFLSEGELRAMGSYQRFAQTESGISPLAAPGISDHTVVVDSDEHDEDGHLGESSAIASRMAAKRLRKTASIERASLLPLPSVEGELDRRPLVVSWGSTYHTLAEARAALTAEGHQLAHLHLRQLWPLRQAHLRSLVGRAASVTVVENNINGELADLLRRVALRDVDRVLTRQDGRPMNVTELASRIRSEVLS